MEAALDLSLSLASAAHDRLDPAQAAADVLAELCATEPIVAAALTCYDPITDEHRPLCSTGYADPVLDYLRSPAFLVRDQGYRQLIGNPARRAQCWRDTSFDYTATRSVTQVFRPAGYAGGATARLTTRGGSYAGDLHVSTTDAALPTRTVLLALHHAAPLLAAAVDVTRRLRLGVGAGAGAGVGADTDAGALSPDPHAALVTAAGEVLALSDPAALDEAWDPSLPDRVARWRLAKHAPGDGRFRHRWRGQWWRVRLARLDRGTLVSMRPDAAPAVLTVRELEVLTLLTDGLLNIAIAHRLEISERTVAHHIEHILDKLGASSRTSAARRAVEDGLRLLP
ncbi:MAG TPA: response regulator transcription factor [Pseudonocardia sp.]|nr:response regulator transcription factor [Pseudonocardia sp.]